MRSDNTIVRGTVAGIAAATAVALWFLVIDGVAGQPFHTPGFLAGLVLGAESVTMGPGGIAIYTVLHYAAFLVIGMATAWLLDRFQSVPGMLMGVILGFLLFDLLFYGSVWLTGVDVVGYLGWAEVLAGNVIAGIVIIGTLNLLGPVRSVSWATILAEYRILREGLVVGLIGAVAVAVWYLLLDLVGGQVFFTPAALGSVIFHGADSAAQVRVDALTVLGYTAVHLAAFTITGLIAAAIAGAAEENEVVLLGAVLLFVTFETFFIGVLAIIAQWLLAVIPWWSIAVANLIAAAGMGYYLWRKHPSLARALQNRELEREPPAAPASPGTSRPA